MEFWKDVKGYDGYQVSDLGRVKLIENEKEFFLNIGTLNGYYTVCLRNGRIRKTQSIHRVVALAFLDIDLNRTQVNHINGIKTDNRLENLEWVNNRENNAHRFKNKKTTSKYTGVCFFGKKWLAKFYVNGKNKHLGSFDTELEAHKSRLFFEKENGIVNKYL